MTKSFSRPSFKCSEISSIFLIGKICILIRDLQKAPVHVQLLWILLQPGFCYLWPGGNAVTILLNVILIQKSYCKEMNFVSGQAVIGIVIKSFFGILQVLKLKPPSPKALLQSLNHGWDKNLIKLELPSQWSHCCSIYISIHLYSYKILSLAPLHYSAVLLFKAS